jgi:adenylyltransferase/sulfurtransferase
VHEIHHRQKLLGWLGESGQARLAGAHALVIGCGALGGVIVEWLARAGVGELTLVDRDVVEMSNLHRQVLFTERDARERVAKAEAAARRVREIAPGVRVHACVEHLGPGNAMELARGAGVIVDGLDNIEGRLVVNDLAVREGIPFVHAAAVAMQGRSLAVLPDGACLRCVFPEMPEPGALETCDTAGVLGPVVGLAGSFAALQAIRVLAGRADLLDRGLWCADLDRNRIVSVAVRRDVACACCAGRRFEHLERASDRTASLCGRGAVQVLPAAGVRGTLSLDRLADRLRAHGRFDRQGDRLHGAIDSARNADGVPYELTVFADGRAIVGRCTDRDAALGVYDRFVGG